MRKYMSKRQRPCDFCRSRKTACRIDDSPPCRSCELHGKECTFVERAKPRRRPTPKSPINDGDHQRPGDLEGLEHSFDLSRVDYSSPHGSPVQPPTVPTLAIDHLLETEQSPPQDGAASLTEMGMQFFNDFDIDGSEYHFMFRTPRSPSIDVSHQRQPASSGVAPSDVVLDEFTSLRPEVLGLSGDMDPFLLRRYRTDDHGTFKFKQLSIQSVQQDPFPVHFLASHPSLFARNRKGAGHDSLPEAELRGSLENLVSQTMGRRLIALYQKFIAPQYPIFSTEQLPDPIDAPPSLLAAIYAITFSFAVYDEQLCIDLAYDSPPYAALSRVIDTALAADLHSPNLAVVQTLLLVTARPSTDPHVSDASYRWSTLGSLVAVAVNVGLHFDPAAWNISLWQASQRRRLSFAIYSVDKWLSASLGRPPCITESNWLVTSLQDGDENCSGLAETQWVDLMEYSSLTSLLAEALSNLYSLRSTEECLQDPQKGVTIADSLTSSLKLKNYQPLYQNSLSPPPSMLRAVLCLGHHYILLLILRASIHPFFNVSQTGPEYRERMLKMKDCVENFSGYLKSIRTDDLNGFWPPWCQAAFSSLCFTQLLMATHAPTFEEALEWIEMLQQTRRHLRLKSNSLHILRLGLLRIDSIFWRGIDQVLDLDAHVLQAFKAATELQTKQLA